MITLERPKAAEPKHAHRHARLWQIGVVVATCHLVCQNVVPSVRLSSSKDPLYSRGLNNRRGLFIRRSEGNIYVKIREI